MKRHDYLPFGEELIAFQGLRTTAFGYTADNVRQKFTSKERDNETGLDYFGAHYNSSAQGRFTSCDPKRMGMKQLRIITDTSIRGTRLLVSYGLNHPQSHGPLGCPPCGKQGHHQHDRQCGQHHG